jgi:hypothetical protein
MGEIHSGSTSCASTMVTTGYSEASTVGLLSLSAVLARPVGRVGGLVESTRQQRRPAAGALLRRFQAGRRTSKTSTITHEPVSPQHVARAGLVEQDEEAAEARARSAGRSQCRPWRAARRGAEQAPPGCRPLSGALPTGLSPLHEVAQAPRPRRAERHGQPSASTPQPTGWTHGMPSSGQGALDSL